MNLIKKIFRLYQKRNTKLFYFISFPKSGRTWIRQFLNHYYFLKFPFSVTNRLGTGYLRRIPNIIYTHKGYDSKSTKELDCEIKSFFRRKLYNYNIIFLVRDPRDVFVSYYFQLTRRGDKAKDLYDRDWDNVKIDELVYDEIYGIKRVVEFINRWYQELTKGEESFLLIRYEEFKKNPYKEFKNLLEFIEDEEINELALKRAIKETNFTKMRQNERINLHSQWQLKTNSIDDNSFKVRRGIVGGFIDYFSENEVIFMNRVIKMLDKNINNYYLRE